jgi:hypothetical protein
VSVARGWRRDLALTAMGDPAERIWMTREQFEAWWARCNAGPRKLRLDASEVGISREMARARIEGRQRVRKIEALAIAHHALGFPMPIEAGSVRAFNDWFMPRFVTREPLNDWLDLGPGTLGLYLQGYTIKQGKRWDRIPDACMIRAVDWVYRVGPVCPWTPPGVAVFDGQEIAS